MPRTFISNVMHETMCMVYNCKQNSLVSLKKQDVACHEHNIKHSPISFQAPFDGSQSFVDS